MERPGFTIILSLAGGLSLLSSAVCGIGVAVLIANGGQTQKPDIQSIIVLTAAALQSLVSYAVCAAHVWLIDRHCAESKPQQPSPAADDQLMDKFGRPVARRIEP